MNTSLLHNHSSSAALNLESIVQQVHSQFQEARRVLSFQEYLNVYFEDPIRHSRDAARYLRDMFDHYGTTQIQKPWGTATRYKLFDLEFLQSANHREGLIGQEEVQAEIYRILNNFCREGRPNKLILMHGPNGSSKSTIAQCLMQALEHYSTLNEGALYRFHWVFPSAKTIKGRIGFSETSLPPSMTDTTSFAHLDEEFIDAKLHCEIRDHPLFLIPIEARRELLERVLKSTESIPEWFLRGRLSHKSQQVYEALLSSYHGNLEQVLRHVSVERYFISRRYRIGAVTLGPQMSIDAGERQITADRSLAALPASLQSITMFDAFGELIDAAGGLLEFSDLLKRPIDAYKYLQLTIETGEVVLQHQNVQLNAVLLASANEVHLSALREHHEWASFHSRFELIRAPYLRSYIDEQAIYDAQIKPQIRRHVAPHSTFIAAFFAVLTRIRKPHLDSLPKELASIVEALYVHEKADLYATGAIPARLDADAAKLLHAHVRTLYEESQAYPIYEGRIGASPREIKTALLDAAQSSKYQCLSPLAVLDELKELSTRTGEYEWLQQESVAGAYHNTDHFLETAKVRLLDFWEDEIRTASGFVQEQSYADLFDRYIRHVSVWVKGEKVRNTLTGAYEDPDTELMHEVENILKVTGNVQDYRKHIMSTIAAWSIDHPGQKVDQEHVFAQPIKRLKEASFEQRSKAIGELCHWLIVLVEEEGKGLEPTQRTHAQEALDMLIQQGYCPHCARDLASGLIRWRLLQ